MARDLAALKLPRLHWANEICRSRWPNLGGGGMISSGDAAPQTSQTEGSSEPSDAVRGGRYRGGVVVLLVFTGLILVLGFAPLSRLAARDQSQPASSFAPVAATSHRGKVTAVRDVPVGLPASARIQTAGDVVPYAVAALGPSGAQALMALLNASFASLPSHPVGSGSYPLKYPYQYPALDAVLDQAPPASFARGATALGAALTVLAARIVDFSDPSSNTISNAGAAAYGILNRARDAGGCAPQLDLLLLVAADEYTSLDILGREERRTESACPHDPTPGWLAGQSQLRRVPLSFSVTYPLPAALAELRTTIATFRHWAAMYPHDTGILTGLGDAYLRAGTQLRSSQPFTARQDLRSAITTYNRASALGGKRDAAPGLARALIGLGEPAEAARLLQPVARASASPGPSLELLIAADEAGHAFGAAEKAARHLDQLGSSGYPNGVAMFPKPTGNSVDSLDDASLPLSFGADRLAPLTAMLVAPGGAGGTVQDLSFIPEYRDDFGITGTKASCPSWTWRRDALLDGHAAQALASWPARFDSLRPPYLACFDPTKLKLLAEAEVGQRLDRNTFSSDIADARQNLLRWAGDLPAAERAAEQWQSATGDKSGMPSLRLGEIMFLRHRYNAAAAEFGLAARRSRLAKSDDDLAVAQAQLDRGAALLAAGRTAEGTQLLRPLDDLGTRGYSYQNSPSNTQGSADSAIQFATVSYYACLELANYERESGNLHAAVEDYTSALDWTPQLKYETGVRPEVVNNNAALAYLGLGDTKTAANLESKALAADPMDPAFLMTAGFIADRAGNIATAAQYDRKALASDPGVFPAANDLGVELTRQHQDGTAVAALRQAVGASPGYALGWFNLGVLESKLGPSHLLASQGAFARAYSLEPALKDRRNDLTIDASVYRTALDLSKPLPPRWSFSQLARPAPAAAAGLLAIMVLGLGLARASGRGGTVLAGQWLDPISERLQSAPLLKRISHPGWGLAATGATFLLAYLRRAAGPAEAVAYTTGVLVLAAAAMTARSALGRARGIAIAQSSWPPAIVFGLVTGALGLPWAPLPVVRADAEDNPPVHLTAPITLAALSLLLFVESAWLHTPLTQAWAVAALIMSASTLLPIGPLDGAHVGKAGIAAAAGVVGGALLVGLGLI